MAIARAKAGLSPSDLEGLRTAVDAGRKPKITFTPSAGQIAGRTGQVIRFDDPGASDEWVVVRFGKDELPFAPSDLQLPERKAAAPKPTEKVETIPPPPWTPAAPPEPARANGKAGTPAVAAEPAAPAAPAPKPVRKAAAKRPAELTVTVSCQDGHWSVQAHRGSKVLVKATSLRASEALKMVALLDAPPVQAVVEEIVEAARVDAEQQAERLRRELAEVEAALADLKDLS